MQMRVNGQGLFVIFNCLGNLLEMRMAMSHPGQCAEVARHGQYRAAIRDAAPIILREVMGNGPLVIRLGKIGIDANGVAEYFDGCAENRGR